VTNAAIHALKVKFNSNGHEDLRQTSTTDGDERFIILDLDPTASKVVSAQSLSPEWQTWSTELSPAPTFGGYQDISDSGMMLRIRGVDSASKLTGVGLKPDEVLAQASDQANGNIHDAMSILATRFQRELDDIQKLGVQWDER